MPRLLIWENSSGAQRSGSETWQRTRLLSESWPGDVPVDTFYMHGWLEVTSHAPRGSQVCRCSLLGQSPGIPGGNRLFPRPSHLAVLPATEGNLRRFLEHGQDAEIGVHGEELAEGFCKQIAEFHRCLVPA